jgi:hypothetical protein
VTLYAYQDKDYVWLCYSVPDGSFGSLDLKIETAALAKPLNLHVSAQLGEWFADEAPPADAESPRWWNHHGWTAYWVRFNGLDANEKPARARFRLGGARELQLSRNRFGAGEWWLVFDLNGVRSPHATQGHLRYPVDGTYRVPPVPR